jgi:hypothetical protein
MKDPLVIYVRRRKIRRRGAIVDGWQASFARDGGGATSEFRAGLIEHTKEIARRVLHHQGEISVIEIDSVAREAP